MIYHFREWDEPQIMSGHLHLGGENAAGETIDINSRYLLRNGRPWIPIMGEFHFSRCRRQDWRKELSKMKAGGITVVSTYLFWIYHEETEGEFNFTGDNDIRTFVEECGRAGLSVVLRVGPWAHGECRNGGFPDWLLKKPYQLRDKNPEFLKQVRIWYTKIAEQVQGLLFPDGGCVVAVQLENEFGSDAEYLGSLKELAIECGLTVPIYTVTGWNSASGAKIPVDEVFPVFGGYCDAPWDQSPTKLPPSVHYFFNQMRNDSAIGADLIPDEKEDGDGWRLPYERYPFATCELGGGIQVTHHRRPIIRPMDIYALSLVKLGDGNNLPGYYMYHGGTNQIGKCSTFQESRATGYPNDYPILSYDFQAPISEYGEIREQYRLLNLLHLFLQDFEEEFAPMTAVDAQTPVRRDDTESLRYGMRTDGTGGFVFINHYQRLRGLKDVRGVVIDTGSVVFPQFDVCGEICFFLPFHLDLSGNDLEYATAQPICRQDNVYFFAEIPGIPAEYKFSDGERFWIEAGEDSVTAVGDILIVTLKWDQVKYLRRLGNFLYIGQDCDLYEMDGQICAVQDGTFGYLIWDGERFRKGTVGEESGEAEAEAVIEETVRPPFEPAPEFACELQMGGERQVIWKKIKVSGKRGFVEINDVFDAAQIYADGTLAADQYYYGKPWRVPAELLAGRECFLAYSELKDDFYREF